MPPHMHLLFHRDPVGWPSPAAFGLGMLIALLTLLLARLRANKAAKVTNSARAMISWLWIGVQGIGIGLAGFGAIDIVPGAPTAATLARAAIVLALMLAAIWLFDSASRTMGRNWSLVARTRSDHSLVQTGPFALVRHPIYVALFLFMLAMATAYGHTNMLIVAIPIYALGTWLRVRQEERLLRDMFGAAYDAYAARVKRFIPGVF
jgi:protein-S-isoprenylcysteine O-methyltransferase Ste14